MGKQAEEMTMVRGNDSDDGSFSWKRKIFSACFPGDDDDDDDGDDGDDGDEDDDDDEDDTQADYIKFMSPCFL